VLDFHKQASQTFVLHCYFMHLPDHLTGGSTSRSGSACLNCGLASAHFMICIPWARDHGLQSPVSEPRLRTPTSLVVFISDRGNVHGRYERTFRRGRDADSIEVPATILDLYG